MKYSIVEGEEPETTSQLSQPFSNEDIASVIESALGGTTEIVESDGDDVAILFTPTSKGNTSGISMKTCDLNQVIENMHMENILERAIPIAEERLKGVGKDPSSNSVPRTKLEDIQLGKDQELMLFGQTESGLSSNIQEIIDEVVSFNAPAISISNGLGAGSLSFAPSISSISLSLC